MRKNSYIGIVFLLSALAFNSYANVNTTNIPVQESLENKISYNIHKNGIDISGHMKTSEYPDGSPVYLYVFKDNVKLYYKYNTTLYNNTFKFNNLVFKQDGEYILHYTGKYHYKLVVDTPNGKDFSKIYSITNNDYTRVKLDNTSGSYFEVPKHSLAQLSSEKKGIQGSKQNKRKDIDKAITSNNVNKNNVVENNNKSSIQKAPKQLVNTTNNNGSSEAQGYKTQLDLLFEKYKNEYIDKDDKFKVSNQFKQELVTIFKTRNRIPSEICKEITRDYAKSVYKLTKNLKNQGVNNASDILKDIRRFRLCR